MDAMSLKLVVLCGLCLMVPILVDGSSDPAPDPERMMEDVSTLVGMGPRPSGSDANRRAREFLAARLRQLGWPVREHRTSATRPDGTRIEVVSLIALREGASAKRVIVATNFDTFGNAGPGVVGASTAAAGPAVVLELARILGPQSKELQLIFFDGSEPFGWATTPRDGLFGSRALALELHRKGELEEIEALIVIDRIGDAELAIAHVSRSSAELRKIMLREASQLGISAPNKPRLRIPNDHWPFARLGLEQISPIFDVAVGHGIYPGQYWRTPDDDLDRIEAQSLLDIARLSQALIGKILAD